MDRTGSQDRTRANARRVEELTAEAKYAGDRYRLYRAKVYGPQLTSPGRLIELERARNLAEARLRRARSGTLSDLGVRQTGPTR